MTSFTCRYGGIVRAADACIYIVGSGRINVAGMSENRMEQLCEAIASVIEG